MSERVAAMRIEAAHRRAIERGRQMVYAVRAANSAPEHLIEVRDYDAALIEMNNRAGMGTYEVLMRRGYETDWQVIEVWGEQGIRE